jgi:hypothetical protein
MTATAPPGGSGAVACRPDDRWGGRPPRRRSGRSRGPGPPPGRRRHRNEWETDVQVTHTRQPGSVPAGVVAPSLSCHTPPIWSLQPSRTPTAPERNR